MWRLALFVASAAVIAGACSSASDTSVERVGQIVGQVESRVHPVGVAIPPRDCERVVADTGYPDELALTSQIAAEELAQSSELIVADLVVGDGCEVRARDVIVVSFLSQNPPDGRQFHNTWGDDPQYPGPQRVIAEPSRLLAGLEDGLIGMKVGGERIVGIPPAVAWGEAGLLVRVHLHEVVDAPYAHQVEFSGDAPVETRVATIVDGIGEGAEFGDTVVAHLAERTYVGNRLLQSTWEDGRTVELVLSEQAGDPLFEDTVGIKVGELRQIIVPFDVLFPGGDGAEVLGLEADDAWVYIVQAVDIIPG